MSTPGLSFRPKGVHCQVYRSKSNRMEQILKRLSLFPDTAAIHDDGLTIAGYSLAELAQEFGTPLYLYDQETLDNALARYLRTLATSYPAPAGLTYAGKAFLSWKIAAWVRQRGLWLDCSSLGEMAIAQAAGLPPEQVLLHGVNKSLAELQAAQEWAGVIVVDNLTELERIARLEGRIPLLWLRFRPEVPVDTHAHIQTGQSGSKFGMDEEEILQAAQFARQHNLPLAGLHFHLGSQLRQVESVCQAIERTVALAAQIGWPAGWSLSPGGGWGVAYHEDDLPAPDIEAYIQAISRQVVESCQRHGLPLPHLQLEPGRSLIARAGVALYRVGGIKRTTGRRWILLDGGLADNPRPALYGARYTALPVQGVNRPSAGPAWLAGPYCESGDVLIENLPLPEIEPGEYLAIPVSGAYQLSMSSNYNGALRPAVLWLKQGQVHLIQRRETLGDLLRRDVQLMS